MTRPLKCPDLRWPCAGRQAGYSLTELMVVCVVLVTLSAVALPTARYTIKRQKEIELRESLRSLRNAIDEYKRYSDAQLIQVDVGTEGYPAEIELLVEGVNLVNSPVKKDKKFLRRIPIDPMSGDTEWGLRSVQDKWNAEGWGGENVFDVFSLSDGVGLNGVPYREW